MSKGKIMPGLFATKDESLHRMLKKPIAGVYSMSNLTSFEPLVDSTIKTFLSELEKRFVATKKSCDWGTWLQYFAVSSTIPFEEMSTTKRSSHKRAVRRGWRNHILDETWVPRVRYRC